MKKADFEMIKPLTENLKDILAFSLLTRESIFTILAYYNALLDPKRKIQRVGFLSLRHNWEPSPLCQL